MNRDRDPDVDLFEKEKPAMFTSYHTWTNAVRYIDPFFCRRNDWDIVLKFEGYSLAAAYAAGDELTELGGVMKEIVYNDQFDATYLVIQEPDFAESEEIA